MPAQNTPNRRSLAPHLEEIARTIRKKIDGKPREGFGTPNLIVRRWVSRLATLAGTSRLTSHSATFKRALAELQGKELPRASQRREATNAVAVIARHLGITDLLPKPEPKKSLPPPKRIKGVNRVKVNGNWLEEHGVEFGDRMLIAMNGDIRPGELGYFEVHKVYDRGEGTHLSHRSLYFLFELNETCRKDYPQEGVCLRTFAERCNGRHVGSEEEPTLDDRNKHGILNYALPFGRVVGVERDRRGVETALRVRPYDEREATTTRIDWNPCGRSRMKRHAAAGLKPQTEEEGARARAPKAATINTLKENIFAGFGLLKGDVLKFETTDETEIRPDELFKYKTAGGVFLTRFVALDGDTLRASNPKGEECEIDVTEATEFARLVSYTRTVLLRPDPATAAAPTDSPAQVIDLNVYRQAHPQRIRNLLFAEK